MQNLRLVSIWSLTRKEKLVVNFHSHKYNELVYYVSGNGKTQIGENPFLFTKHHFAVIPAHTEHSEIHHVGSEVICLEFDGSHDLPIGFYADQNNAVYDILLLLLKEVREQKRNYEDMLLLQLNALMLHISRIQSSSSATKNLSYIINFLRENFHEKISLSSCARELNISYDHFQHKFKAVTGYSPQQFLITQRLLAAKKLLEEGIYTCTEIAFRCGFCTSAQFSALFKSTYGITPLQYKKQHKKKA